MLKGRPLPICLCILSRYVLDAPKRVSLLTSPMSGGILLAIE